MSEMFGAGKDNEAVRHELNEIETEKNEIVINRLADLKYKKFSPLDTNNLEEELKKMEESGLNDIRFNFESNEQKQSEIEQLKTFIDRLKLQEAKDIEAAYSNSPIERIEKLRDDFLNSLENNTLETFSSKFFCTERQNIGIRGGMYIQDKKTLNYTVYSVIKINEQGEIVVQDDNQGTIYQENIKLNEKQLKNFLNLIDKNIERSERTIEEMSKSPLEGDEQGLIHRLQYRIQELKVHSGILKDNKEHIYPDPDGEFPHLWK